MAKKLIDLDDLYLSPQVVLGWSEMIQRIMPALAHLGVLPGQVGIEYAELEEETGELAICCQAGPFHLRMPVPDGQWAWRHQN